MREWPMRWRGRIAAGARRRRRLKNIRRLRDGAHAVVTGQQVGLFGGPLLSLFKVASVLALAKQVESCRRRVRAGVLDGERKTTIWPK